MPGASTYDFSLEPLFAPINSIASTYTIMSTKVEVILAKVSKGQKWSSLESKESLASDDKDLQKEKTTLSSLPTAPAAPSGPSYPTSSRSGPKDWDKLAKDLTSKPKKAPNKGKGKATETSSPPESGAEEDEETYDSDEADPVSGFFKKLYKDAPPDTRRAMIKSYQESNGTALSTDWTEVGKKRVEITPPDGMEAKRWNE